jgi:hypothetical protein
LVIAGKAVSAQELTASDNLDKIVGRAKRDLLWVLVSVAVAVAAGLAAGQLF